jgi:hypothetical protein
MGVISNGIVIPTEVIANGVPAARFSAVGWKAMT